MQNYKLRIRIYDPINEFIIPGISSYREEEFNCDVKQFFKSEDENDIIFTIEMPYNYVVRLKDTFRETQKNNCKNDCREEIRIKNEYIEHEEEPNITDEIFNQLDILSDEINEFLSEVNEAIDLDGEELEDMEHDREDLEKIKKLRADLEKIKLEFGEII